MNILDRFRRRERRSTVGTDALVAALLARATGSTVATGAGTAALEAAAGTWAAAFAGATVGGPRIIAAALTPELLATAARQLIRRGECLFEIQVRGDRLHLLLCSWWNVRGGSDPESWTYEVQTPGPSAVGAKRRVPAASILHLRFAVDPAHPWRGLGPLQWAVLADRLAGGTEGVLADEASGKVGHVLPGPGTGGADPAVAQLKADLGKAKGETLLVESGSQILAGRSSGGGTGAADLWRSRRFGPSPPEALVQLHELATRCVLAACGVPVELVSVQTGGTASREGWRRFLFGRVAPLARQLETELQAKLDPGLELTFPELRASDLQGRARAYESLTRAGMDPARAAEESGFAGAANTGAPAAAGAAPA